MPAATPVTGTKSLPSRRTILSRCDRAWRLRTRDGERAAELARTILAEVGESGDPEIRARATAALAASEIIRGELTAAVDRLERFLPMLPARGTGGGMIWGVIALARRWQGRGDEAREAGETALRYARGAGRRDLIALALNGLGNVRRQKGDPLGALELHQQALAEANAIGDPEGIASAWLGLGNSYERLARYDEAKEAIASCLEAARRAEHLQLEAYARGNLAVIHHFTGATPAAIEEERRCLELKQRLGDRLGLSVSYNNLGIFHRTLGDYAQAFEEFTRALEVCEELGDRQGEAVALNNLGDLYEGAGDSIHVLESYLRSLRIAEEIDDASGRAFSLQHLGRFYLRHGDPAHALLYYRASLRIIREMGERSHLRSLLIDTAQLLDGIGRPDLARTEYEAAIEAAAEVGDPSSEASALAALGRHLHGRGETDEAVAMYARGLELVKGTGSVAEEEELLGGIAESYRARGDERLARTAERRRQELIAMQFGAERGRRFTDLASSYGRDRLARDGRRLGLPEAAIEEIAALTERAPTRERAAERGASAVVVAPSAIPARGGQARVTITTFGGFDISVESGVAPTWSRRRARDLFKLLLIHYGRPMTVERIHDLLWEGELRRNIPSLVMNAASHLRSALGGIAELVCRDGAYLLELAEDVEVDLFRFREAIVQARRGEGADERLQRFEEAVALHAGDFLPEAGESLWCADERSLLRDAWLEGLEFIARERLRRGDYERAVEAGRRALAADDLGEVAWEVVFAGLAALGRHGELEAARERCRAAFARDGGEGPGGLAAGHRPAGSVSGTALR